jgi:hypothetical protein
VRLQSRHASLFGGRPRNSSGSFAMLTNAPGLVAGQQVGGRLSAGIVLEVEIAERLTVLVAEKHALFNSSTAQRGGKRREACSISPQR